MSYPQAMSAFRVIRAWLAGVFLLVGSGVASAAVDPSCSFPMAGFVTCSGRAACQSVATTYSLGYTFVEIWTGNPPGYEFRDGQYSNGSVCQVPAPECPEGKVRIEGQCVNWCASDHTKAATDPTCAPCPEGTIKESYYCRKDCSQKPTIGDIGMTLVLKDVGACPEKFNYDGCEYDTADMAFASPGYGRPGECVLWGPFEPTGVGIIVGIAADAPWNAPPPPNPTYPTTPGPTSPSSPPPPNTPPTCPSGFTYSQSWGICTQTGIPTEPAAPVITTTGTPTAVPVVTPPVVIPSSCPVGSALVDGSCVYQTPLPVGCPAGLVKNAQGNCESVSNLRVTTDPNTNQPVLTPDPTGTGGETGDPTAPEGWLKDASDALDAHLKTFKDALADMVGRDPSAAAPSAWSWAKNPMMVNPVACEPLSTTVGGRSFVLDWCPVAQKIREIGAYVLYIVTLFGLFRILTGATDA